MNQKYSDNQWKDLSGVDYFILPKIDLSLLVTKKDLFDHGKLLSDGHSCEIYHETVRLSPELYADVKKAQEDQKKGDL